MPCAKGSYHHGSPSMGKLQSRHLNVMAIVQWQLAQRPAILGQYSHRFNCVPTDRIAPCVSVKSGCSQMAIWTERGPSSGALPMRERIAVRRHERMNTEASGASVASDWAWQPAQCRSIEPLTRRFRLGAVLSQPCLA